MGKKEKKDDFLMQGAILAFAAVVTKIIGVAYRIPLTNILGDEGNGFYGYAFEVYSIALILSSFSFPIAVSKMVSARLAMKQKRNAFRVFLCALVFSVVVGLAVSLFIFYDAGRISANLMESPLSVYALKMLAPGLFIVSVMGVLRGYFQGMGTMVPTAISQVIEQLINAILSIAGASVLFKVGMSAAKKNHEELLGPAYGAAGGTFGTIMGALAGLVFLIFVFALSKNKIKKNLASDKTKRTEGYGRIFKLLILTILPVIFSTAIYNINQLIDLTVFNKAMAAQAFAEKEYMALQGIYTGKYNTLINVPLAMANGLAASVIPTMTAALTSNNKKLIYSKIDQTIRFTMLVAIPCFVGFVTLASPLMVLLYNDASATPAYLLAIGAVTVVFYSWSTVTNSILQGLDKMACPAKNALISLVIHLGALFLMLYVFKWNIYSLVGSNIVFSITMSLLNVRDIKKACGYRQELSKSFVKPFIASIIMGAVTYVVYTVVNLTKPGRFLPAIVAMIVAVIVYAVAILKIGMLSDQDIKDLPKGEMLYSLFKKLHLLPKKRHI